MAKLDGINAHVAILRMTEDIRSSNLADARPSSRTKDQIHDIPHCCHAAHLTRRAADRHARLAWAEPCQWQRFVRVPKGFRQTFQNKKCVPDPLASAPVARPKPSCFVPPSLARSRPYRTLGTRERPCPAADRLLPRSQSTSVFSSVHPYTRDPARPLGHTASRPLPIPVALRPAYPPLYILKASSVFP